VSEPSEGTDAAAPGAVACRARSLGVPRMSRRVALCALLLVLARGGVARAEDPKAGPTVVFLEGEDAKKAISDDAAEPYFALLQPIEMTAKMKSPPEGADLAALREDCRRHYRENVVPTTEEERKAVLFMIARLHAAWAADYPLLAKTPWSILTVSDKVEATLPHTRGSHVVLPQAFLHDFVQAAKDPKGELAVAFLGLLAHEQAHVMQRKMPEEFAKLYASWGFEHAKAVASHPWLDRLRATNPDGIDVRWVFPLKEGTATTLVQPLVTFTDGPEPRSMPEDLQLIAVTLEKDGDALRPKVDGERPVFRDLPTLAAYQDLWGGIDESFHPNEIFAVLFASMVVKEKFQGPDLPRPSTVAGKDFATLRAWCRTAFSGKPATK
jgi:hypothetical protein